MRARPARPGRQDQPKPTVADAAAGSSAPEPPLTEPPASRSGDARGRLVSRATWNLIDQIVSSASNFALSILIARSVDRYAFGAFAVSFTLFSFLVGIVRAIGRYPLVIRFSGASPAELRHAIQAATGSVCCFGLLSGLLTALVGVVIGRQAGAALVAMGVVLPLVLLQDAWRGVLIGTGRPAAATLNDAIWTISQFVAVGWLLALGVKSASILVLTWGAAGGLAAAVGVLQTRAVPRLQDTRRWVVEHWDQAGFFLAEWVLVLGALHGSLLVIAVWASVEDVGAIRGGQVLLGPLLLLGRSAFEFLLPELGRRPQMSAWNRLRLSYVASGSLLFVGLIWGGVLLALPDDVGRELMGETWPTTKILLPASALWVCGTLLSTGPAAVLRALGRAQVGFRLNALTTALLVVFGFVGFHLYGVRGALVGFALAHWLVAPLWWREVHAAVAEAAGAEKVK